MTVLIAVPGGVLRVDPDGAGAPPVAGLEGCTVTELVADAGVPGRAWCATRRHGVFRSDDSGATWQTAGLADRRLTTIQPDPTGAGGVWAGGEPSRVWHSLDAGESWEDTTPLDQLPSSHDWAFPPRPDTHHVRWIACHPHDPDRLWVAIEAGALVRSVDGGRRWLDRTADGPRDTHELGVHPDAPDRLRVAAGDGYFESGDGGEGWTSPMEGLGVGYLRSVALDADDADIVLVSAATGPRSTYQAGAGDGRIYRRKGGGRWERVIHGWPDPPSGVAPLVRAGTGGGLFWAVDERGLHRSGDGGLRWSLVHPFASTPKEVWGLAVVQQGPG